MAPAATPPISLAPAVAMEAEAETLEADEEAPDTTEEALAEASEAAEDAEEITEEAEAPAEEAAPEANWAQIPSPVWMVFWASAGLQTALEQS